MTTSGTDTRQDTPQRTLRFYGPEAGASYRPCPSAGWAWVVLAAIWFWPLAVVALTYAVRVSPSWLVDDHVGAEYASRQARRWGRNAVVTGAVLWTAGLLIGLVVTAG